MAWYNPTDPRQRNFMLLGIVALALVYVYHAYVLTPRREANAQLQARVESLENLNRRAAVITESPKRS